MDDSTRLMSRTVKHGVDGPIQRDVVPNGTKIAGAIALALKRPRRVGRCRYGGCAIIPLGNRERTSTRRGTNLTMAEISPNSLDHIALWVADRDALASFACDHLGMHVIEQTDKFTLVGADARRGKLTLFDADGELAAFDAPEGLGVGLVPANGAPGPDYDLDHVVLRVPDPGTTAGELEQLGFENRDGRLAIADKDVRLSRGNGDGGERPLLNHIAVLVDSAGEVRDEAERRGLEVADFVDAPNTLAVFVWGPDRIKLEYVEHKPGFSLV
jgi:catechol 2,3-dioxygenase-like lactoylglutathione lyase family enzyme